jgi:hypothetical protein
MRRTAASLHCSHTVRKQQIAWVHEGQGGCGQQRRVSVLLKHFLSRYFNQVVIDPGSTGIREWALHIYLLAQPGFCTPAFFGMTVNESVVGRGALGYVTEFLNRFVPILPMFLYTPLVCPVGHRPAIAPLSGRTQYSWIFQWTQLP